MVSPVMRAHIARVRLGRGKAKVVPSRLNSMIFAVFGVMGKLP
jgi:hypothetical protein